jgi:hypothetical protein
MLSVFILSVVAPLVIKSCIHNISFSLSVTNTPKKLQCYMTLGWRGFPGTNTLAFWAQISFCSYGTDSLKNYRKIFVRSF